jgi:hypothetical protein
MFRDCATSSLFDYEEAYTSTLAGAREYLRRVLGSELEYFPRFLELPAELRLMVYQEVFRVDGVLQCMARVTCKYRRSWRSFRVLPKLSEEVIDHRPTESDDWTMTYNDTYTGPSERMLSLLQTNRQIFQEAMPIFYNTNTFMVDSLAELSFFLGNCGATRRVHFTRIKVWNDSHSGKTTTKKAFDLLAQAKQLQFLRILTDDRPFLKDPSTKPEDVYWVKLLCKLNVPTLEVEGDGGKIETYTEDVKSRKASEPKQIKPKKTSPTVSRTYETRSKKAVMTT